MNKYQEALNHQQKMIDRNDLHWTNAELSDNRTAYYALEELVDRATPIKAEQSKGYVECPKCHEVSIRNKFCPYCGQALEWEGK